MFIYFTVSNIVYIYIYIIVYINPHCLLMFEVFSTLPMLIWTPPPPPVCYSKYFFTHLYQNW